MKPVTLFACLLALSLFAGAQDRLTNNPADVLQLQSGGLDDLNNDPAMGGPLWAEGTEEYNNLLRALRYPYMNWHGGVIMPNVTVSAIFWGTSWPNDRSGKIGGIDSWYQGFGNSDYAGASDEYTGTNGQVTSNVVYNGHFIDPTPFPGRATPAVIGAEVCKMINNPDPTGNGYYPVYVDRKRAASIGRSDFCAWHSTTKCNGVRVQIAFFWNLDRDWECDNKDTSKLHTQGLSALANASAHELSEARTDPTWFPKGGPPFTGWYDYYGYENGDKCLGVFGPGNGLVTFSNGTKWKLQSEWSNNAYKNGKGVRRRGCVLSSPQ